MSSIVAAVEALMAPADPLETASVRAPAPSHPIPPPAVPGFEVEGVLGRGGMGVVYKARQTALNRTVALKMILAGGHASPAELARFLQEGEAVAALDHPNVVRVYEAGRHAGLPYFAMEYVPGGPLAARLKDGPLAPAEAARITAGVASGVAYSHARGILHRDLKPANVLLAEGSTPKVTDFGLAKRLDGGDGLTATGAVMGTPSYMAPEQALGDVKAFGPTTDVYGVGAILYCLLTGRPPFQAPSPIETLHQVVAAPPVPPRQLQPGTPRDLEVICLKCLEKDPARRYPKADVLADDLDRFLGGRPILARPVSRAERAARWARRNPASAAAVGLAGLVVLLAAGGGVAVAAYQSQRATNIGRELNAFRKLEAARAEFRVNLARARRLRADQNLSEARPAYAGVVAVLTTTADAADPGEAAAIRAEQAEVEAAVEARAAVARARDDLVAFRRHRDEAIYHATLFTGTDPIENHTRARAAATAGLALFGLDRDPVAAERLTGWVARGYTPDEREELATGCQELLMVLAEAVARPRPKPSAPAEGLRAAVAVLARADALAAAGWPVVKSVPRRLVGYHNELGDAAAAAAAEARASAIADEQPVDWFVGAVEPFQRPGRVDTKAAAEAAGRLVRRWPDHFWGQYLLAVCRLDQQRLPDVRDGMGVCLALRPEFDLARVYRGYARAGLGDLVGAQADYDDVLGRSADPLVRFLALTNRGILRAEQAKAATIAGARKAVWTAAEEDLRAALAIRGDKHEAYRNLATARRGLGDPAGAVAVLSEAAARFPGLAVLYLDRGDAYLQMADRGAARQDFERAVKLEPDGPTAAAAHLELGRLHLRADDAPAALTAVDQSLRAAPPTADAHRVRAAILARASRFAEAAEAAGECIRLAGQTATTRDFHQLGLACMGNRDYPRAVEAFTTALARTSADSGRDRRALLSARAAAYLLAEAPRPAAADYDAVLVGDPADVDALCGRAEARVRIGEFRAGLADAAAVEARSGATPRQLYLAARTRAVAWQQLDANWVVARRHGYAAEDVLAEFGRCAAALRRAVEARPAAERTGFWDDTVSTDPAFRGMLRYDAITLIEAAARGK